MIVPRHVQRVAPYPDVGDSDPEELPVASHMSVMSTLPMYVVLFTAMVVLYCVVLSCRAHRKPRAKKGKPPKAARLAVPRTKLPYVWWWDEELWLSYFNCEVSIALWSGTCGLKSCTSPPEYTTRQGPHFGTPTEYIEFGTWNVVLVWAPLGNHVEFLMWNQVTHVEFDDVHLSPSIISAGRWPLISTRLSTYATSYRWWWSIVVY